MDKEMEEKDKDQLIADLKNQCRNLATAYNRSLEIIANLQAELASAKKLCTITKPSYVDGLHSKKWIVE